MLLLANYWGYSFCSYATFRSFRHRVIKKRVFAFVITIIWVPSGLLLGAAYLFRTPVSYLFIWISFNGFCLFVICVSYTCIVVKMSCGVHPQHHGAASRERKLTKTLLIVTFASLLMWLPFTISWLLLSTVLVLPSRASLHLYLALIIFFFANPLFNPIVYVIRMPDFKRALVSLFRRQQRPVEIFPLGPL